MQWGREITSERKCEFKLLQGDALQNDEWFSNGKVKVFFAKTKLFGKLSSHSEWKFSQNSFKKCKSRPQSKHFRMRSCINPA